MRVTLRKRLLKTGRISLYLDHYPPIIHPVYAQAINDINSISITRNDFNLNLIQSTDDVNFDTLPQFENKSDEHSDIINMAKSGKKLEAVKLLKGRTGWDLRRCKDWVEARC